MPVDALGQVGEVGDAVGPQRRVRRRARHVADCRSGDVVDADADQFALGVGDLVVVSPIRVSGAPQV